MADLLCVDRTASYNALKGLPEYGIKGFIDIEVEHTIRQGEGNTVFESLNWICLRASSLFYEIRC